MYVVVGLGNPGAGYAMSRHNVGFMALERIAARCGVALEARVTGLRIGATTYGEQPTLLVQPCLFMNRSGNALSNLTLDWMNARMIAIYDDVDLPVGQLRLRRDGGAGGHRGVASIIERFGASFERVRIGVGRPPLGVETADYVLQPMSMAEMETFEEPLGRACDAVRCILEEGIETAMSRFNGRVAVDRGAEPTRNGEDDDERV
jgi:PTH1 family peptidyl-tRNA hydrolase